MNVEVKNLGIKRLLSGGEPGAGIDSVKKKIEGDDKEAIEKKTAALGEASGSLAQKLYAEQAAQGDAGGAEAALVDPGGDPEILDGMIRVCRLETDAVWP